MSLNEYKKKIESVRSYLLGLQKEICEHLREIDPHAQSLKDNWEHEQGGGGLSQIFKEGSVIEKGGVNFSHVRGKSLPAAATATRPELLNRHFQAMGISVVIHPCNPYAPTTHMNVRFLIAEKENATPVWWFGGGFDLTPFYGFEEDAVHWHQTARKACMAFGESFYPRFKKNCDHYFFLPHRNETRGIGGLFFDDFNELGFDGSFAFMRSVGNHFMQAYSPIIQRRMQVAFSSRERQFQLYRRGRYVEFNLIYDRGTLFGLQSGGRTESILMSLPPMVRWEYNWEPKEGSHEEDLYKRFLIARDWL